MPDGERYVYGITRSGAEVPLPTAGVEGHQVKLVERGPLSALVSEAPDGPVKANRRNLMAHTDVLQQVAAEACVLPMRFGVVMPSEAVVADELLGRHEDALLEQLDAFEPLVELDLKVVCPEEVLLSSILSSRPDLAELREQIRGKPDDATYFERLRLGELVAAAVEERRGQLVHDVVRRLEPLAVRTEVSDPTHEQMLLNVAFLVERAKVAPFDEAVSKIAEELGPDMRSKYVGPLPPFHFVVPATDTGAAAWA